MVNREYIFLIDRSGSMQGIPIKLAVRALKVFLHSLPLGCFVNVYSFGSEFESMFEQSYEYSQETLEAASVIVTTFDADMGGTELYAPIVSIVNQPLKQRASLNLERHIFLLTDGAVSNTQLVVDLIRKHSDTTKVHTFGIGQGVSTELVK